MSFFAANDILTFPSRAAETLFAIDCPSISREMKLATITSDAATAADLNEFFMMTPHRLTISERNAVTRSSLD
jgi:hypothetical protein